MIDAVVQVPDGETSALEAWDWLTDDPYIRFVEATLDNESEGWQVLVEPRHLSEGPAPSEMHGLVARLRLMVDTFPRRKFARIAAETGLAGRRVRSPALRLGDNSRPPADHRTYTSYGARGI